MATSGKIERILKLQKALEAQQKHHNQSSNDINKIIKITQSYLKKQNQNQLGKVKDNEARKEIEICLKIKKTLDGLKGTYSLEYMHRAGFHSDQLIVLEIIRQENRVMSNHEISCVLLNIYLRTSLTSQYDITSRILTRMRNGGLCLKYTIPNLPRGHRHGLPHHFDKNGTPIKEYLHETDLQLIKEFSKINENEN